MKEHFDSDLIRISMELANHFGRSGNKVKSWKQLRKLFLVPTITPDKFRQYRNANLEERNRLKGVPGWFLGAHVKDGCRKAENIEDRDIITPDLDNLSVEEFDELQNEEHYLNQFEYFAHTTRSHTPEEPRVRVVGPRPDNTNGSTDARN